MKPTTTPFLAAAALISGSLSLAAKIAGFDAVAGIAAMLMLLIMIILLPANWRD